MSVKAKRIFALLVLISLVFGGTSLLHGSALSHKLGDVDFDGIITPADARIVLRASVGLEEIKETADAVVQNEGSANNKLDTLKKYIILNGMPGPNGRKQICAVNNNVVYTIAYEDKNGLIFIRDDLQYDTVTSKEKIVMSISDDDKNKNVVVDYFASDVEKTNAYAYEWNGNVTFDLANYRYYQPLEFSFTSVYNCGTHTWDSGYVTKYPTCSIVGEKSYICTKCGETKIENIPVDPNNHTWDSGNVTKDATCTAKGVFTYTCTGCGATKTKEIAMIVHVYDKDGKCISCGAIKPDSPQKEYDIEPNNNGIPYVCPCGNRECKCTNKDCKCDGKNPASPCTDAKCPCNRRDASSVKKAFIPDSSSASKIFAVAMSYWDSLLKDAGLINGMYDIGFTGFYDILDN